MELLIKTAAVCIPAALMAGVLKKDSPAMALLIALAAGCVVIATCAGALRELTAFVAEVAETAGISNAVLAVLLKAVGIALISRLAADLCRDAGLGTAGSAAELAGAAAALYAALPLMRGVFRMMRELIWTS